MVVVLIIPTGLGCPIGGHAGDANPVAKLLGACCDKLILHPNVVNASDINEMPANALYVEGSILDRFLEGSVQLEERRRNRILVVANKPLTFATINAVSAARATIGADVVVVGLDVPLRMTARLVDGRATGDVTGVDDLVSQVTQYNFDALAIHTSVDVERDVALRYYKLGGVNPWGGVEAKASRMIADQLNKPIAHAPLETPIPEDDELYRVFDREVDPRIAAEAVSNCHLHCVLKGLHQAPSIGENGISVDAVDVMVSPHDCYGRPHRACALRGIPIIYVLENSLPTQTAFDVVWTQQDVPAVNYLEAAGMLMADQAGVSLYSVRRPLAATEEPQTSDGA